MSFHNRTTGAVTTQLPVKYAVNGFSQPLRAAYEAGNITLPYGGWYTASITDSTPEPHQVKVDGTWTYDDETGVASMTRTVADKSLAQATAEIKAEAQRRINLKKGGDDAWRGENILSKAARLVRKESLGTITVEEAALLATLNAAGDEVDRLRAKSNELEAQYKTTPFNYTADAAWAAE